MTVVRIVCFWLKLIYCKLMNKIALPTVDDAGQYIDPRRVQCAYIFEDNGVKFIHCFVDGKICILIWTLGLERWFIASGIDLPFFEHKPNGANPVSVVNVPDKYNQKMAP